MRITLGAATDVGLVRAGNEDAFLLLPERGLAAVCDGMGGHAFGEEASALAVATLKAFPWQDVVQGEESLFLKEALHQSNDEILKKAREPGHHGMGTTAVCFWRHGSNQVLIGHVGDSRCYLVRKGKAVLLTDDHSMAKLVSKNGGIPYEMAVKAWPTNILSQALGTCQVIEPSIGKVTVQAGDMLILCSDGFSNEVGDDRIAGLVEGLDATAAAERLVREAVLAGGRDNVTVVVGLVA